MADKDYCATCYGAAKANGRPVKMTEVYHRPICSLCESRIRNGLVHYVPSNGSEGRAFISRCTRCRHYQDNDGRPQTCTWGILDKITGMMIEESDSAKAWHDPANLETTGNCLRFTDRNDPHGDPPPKDCEGQIFFGELLAVKEDGELARRAARAASPELNGLQT